MPGRVNRLAIPSSTNCSGEARRIITVIIAVILVDGSIIV